MMEVGKIYGDDGVEIRIDEITEDYILATVISVDEFWRAPCRAGFVAGQKLRFGPEGGKIEGVLGTILPWFSLDVYRESFEHYR